ncbi:DnaD domain-containing protein [Mammaliicoccus sciuri]|uniref:DnaD domain-containing protein n=1 Tax=Mammaliicoccus sciuri TaxID=1296 RepID=UPI002885BDD0|nr:DnaD domain protein [Mammaliicoccus sciuri]MDT0694725.1 DnaD domain protein [Mammaliicoccus sciuri]
MAKFRQVYTEFWEDPKVQEEFTPEDRYFYLYLLTNPRTTQIGIYQITKKQIAFELGYSTESINALIDRFENHHKLIKYNIETREIAIKNWGRYNFNKAGKPVEDCVRSELSRVKDNGLIEYTKPNIDNSKIINIYDTYTIRGTTGGQEKEEEKEEEENKKKNKNRREKEVIAFDFYQENGFGLLNPHIKDEMGSYIDDFENDGNEIVTKALKITLERNKISWGYTKGILKNWLQANLKNMDQIEAYEKSRVISKNAGQHEASEINGGKIYRDLKTTNDMSKEEIDQIFGGE